MNFLDKKNLRKLNCVVTAQTLYHLHRIQAQCGYKNVGQVIDKIIRAYQLDRKLK